jgi:nucleotide-binding universal stress UspA family protein
MSSGGEAGKGPGPVMLALSTFRQSDKAVEMAVQKAKQAGRLIIVHVADVNLARYLIGTDLGLYPDLKDTCEKEVLEQHEREGMQKAEAIARWANAEGIETSIHVCVGRFALVCLEMAERERPAVIVTTRSRRPEWVRRFFGSPVNDLIARARCPVIEA